MQSSIIAEAPMVTSVTRQNYYIPERYEEGAAILESESDPSFMKAEL